MHGIPCRHIYCILQREPLKTDCSIRHFKFFEIYFGRDKQLSVFISKQLQFPLPGPLVGDTWILEPNAREYHDITWFRETIDKMVLRPGVVDHYSSEGQQSSLRTLTNCYESPDDTNYNTNEYDDTAVDSDDDEAPEDRRNGKVTEPFRVLVPFFDGVCRLIEDESDIKCAKMGMNMIMKELMERKKNKIQKGSGTTSLVSFPEMDKRIKDYRQRPMGSPRK
jgi:hypothetical protein